MDKASRAALSQVPPSTPPAMDPISDLPDTTPGRPPTGIQKPTNPMRRPHAAFTLIELLSIIAITAVLVTVSLFFIASYVS